MRPDCGNHAATVRLIRGAPSPAPRRYLNFLSSSLSQCINIGPGAVNLKFLPVFPRVRRRNFKFINRTRIIKLPVLLMFPKFA
jgi:hypothetical protein